MDSKITFIKKIIIYYFILCYSFSMAQNCQNYGTKCDLIDNSYAKGSVSQGLKIAYGQMVSIVCMFYKGNENFISVCGEFDAGLIQFRILNFETKEVLYDNTDDNFKQNTSLWVEITVKAIIQLSAPNAKYSFTEDKCVGLLVAYKTLEK